MNANTVARHYASLTAEERFRLILAASGRGDEAERDRLSKAGKRITLSMPDHSPYAHALNELSHLTFIELVEEAAGYREVLRWADDALAATIRESGAEETGEVSDDDDEEEDKEEIEAEEGEEPANDDTDEGPEWDRLFQMAYAAGFLLRTKAEGWKLFCQRMTVPPFLGWEMYPGFDRLKRALALAEKAAFVPEGMLRWLNRIRPEGKLELTSLPLTVESVADETAAMFRARVEWWGG